ncbi:VirB4-like conjugal transfer ATPase, CD1110 family [Pseudomonadota bacterium]
MAEPGAQNSDDAKGDEGKKPEWLKKAQALAKHEEKGATAVEAEVAAGEQPETTPIDEVTFEEGEQAAKETAVAVEEEAATPVAEPAPVAEAPKAEAPKAEAPKAEAPKAEEPKVEEPKVEGGKVPSWLKKASEKAAGLVQPAPAPEKEETPKEAEAPAPAPAAPAAEIGAVPTTAEGEVPEWVKKSESSQAPQGLLETKKEAPAPVEEKPPVAEAEPGEQPEEKAEAVKPGPAKAEKKAVFDSAKDVLMTSMKEVNTAVEKGTTAGVSVATEKDKPVVPVTPEKADKKAVTMEEKKKLVEAEKVYQEGLATIRDLIAPSSMDIQYDHIRVEGMYAQSFYVYAYPRFLDANWLSPIINFDVTMDIAQFIYPTESETIMRILKKKVAQMQSSIRIAQEKGMVSDPAVETALQDAEELRTSIQRGQEKLFQFGLYFTIYTDSDKKLKKVSKQLESILGGKLIMTKRSELQMEHAFNSTIPLCMDELEISRNMNTSPLSSTFPFSSSDLTSNEGILYGLNRHNDSLIIFDRFSLENANSVVFAKSGAGKSYAVKLEILRAMMVGTDVIVIDPENEYEALSQTVGGSYLKVSLTADRRINPFDLPSPLEGEDTQPGDLLRQNIITLSGLLKLMLGDLSPQEESILDKALIDVYALKGITMEVVNPAEFPPPTMEDLYDILVTSDGGADTAQRLQKYTSGSYSGIFNKPTNVDLESGLMVFSIRDLEDALRPTAMYIILNYIWNRVRSKLKKRMLVIDEAWTMMQHEDSAKFLFGLVKRARKYYLGISTITQDVEDFVKSKYGKPVVTNSSMQLLLKQAPAAIDTLGKIFDLTEGEKYMLLNSGVGQGLFFAGLKHVAIQIIASYTEDKIVTTNPEEILKSQQSAEEFETD